MESKDAEEQRNYQMDSSEVLRYEGYVCVPRVPDLRQEILTEAHQAGYSIHPGSTKMYRDLQINLWWPSMKKDIAEYAT